MIRKGFTLVEMLAVIVILAALGLIVIPLVNRSFNSSIKDLYNEQMETLKNGAKNWSTDHLKELPDTEGGMKEVTLSELITGGYVDKEIKNPKTKKPFETGTKVTIVNWDGNYSYIPIDGANLVIDSNVGITGWSNGIGSGGVTALTATNKNGVRAAKVSVTTATTSWGVATKTINNSLLHNGGKYTLEFDMHSTRAITIQVNIMLGNGTQNLATKAVKASIPANKDTHVKGEFIINSTAITSQPLYFSTMNQVGEYTFWNVELYKQ
ncbi:MAG: prepilin-type N-terminal cleavage/methylation domain-containing protein [Bacilli bacterium]|nr:prepilin-type N-terminal cleavage/methylation domain-containing protein [Bacilli bacterium]